MTVPPLPILQDATLTLHDRVATLTLNRDDVRNELTGTALVDDILATVDWANRAEGEEEGVSVLILTGAGKAFSAGGNIKHMADRAGAFAGDVYAVQKRYREGIQRMTLAMHRLEIPAIAAINGAAIGAGFDLTCMCDLRLAADTAQMGETFVNLGIIPGDGGAWLLQRLIGYQKAAELTFTGRVFSAQEALELGLVLQVHPGEALLPAAQTLAAAMAAKPPQALRLAKRLMGQAQRLALPDFLDLCAAYQGMCHNSQDHLEAVGAFLEKRPPHYRGC